MSNVTIILLAAGQSKRLGSPKQLVVVNGKYLLQHVIDEVSNSSIKDIILVLGAYKNKILSVIKTDTCKKVYNDDWNSGFSSSIKVGVQSAIALNQNLEAVILVMCDQPFFTSSIIDEIISLYQSTGKKIINCRYESSYGPPTFFHKDIFSDLISLSGDEGAKMVVNKYLSDSTSINFQKGSIDIDTQKDIDNL